MDTIEKSAAAKGSHGNISRTAVEPNLAKRQFCLQSRFLLLLTPLMLNRWGPDGFGLFGLSSSLLVSMALTDGGVRSLTRLRLTEAIRNADEVEFAGRLPKAFSLLRPSCSSSFWRSLAWRRRLDANRLPTAQRRFCGFGNDGDFNRNHDDDVLGVGAAGGARQTFSRESGHTCRGGIGPAGIRRRHLDERLRSGRGRFVFPVHDHSQSGFDHQGGHPSRLSVLAGMALCAGGDFPDIAVRRLVLCHHHRPGDQNARPDVCGCRTGRTGEKAREYFISCSD